ncbi:MAG: hypothetical protein IPH28_23580 [Cytophagaceae bacterium]|nr:hypothetical protein [Cytophagaceae bacterium]
MEATSILSLDELSKNLGPPNLESTPGYSSVSLKNNKTQKKVLGRHSTGKPIKIAAKV